MPIRATSPSVSKILATYIHQRIRPLLMAGLAIFLYLFSRPVSVFTLRSLVAVALLLAFLFVFRLYDDLLQVRNDQGKPARDYLEIPAQKTLRYCLLASLAILLGPVAFISVSLAFSLFCFILINHLLYLLMVNNRTAAGLLPLIKYPFVYLLLQFPVFSGSLIGAHLVFPSIALFFAFVAFESLEDNTFPVPVRYSYILQFLAFALVAVGKLSGISILVFSLLLTLSMIWTFFRMKSYPYVFMFCFLVFKIVIDKL